mmetsp:Transcript_134172/g.416997  ORF Transcript_134172/g.416997 Transcript_134172/m.416997 type:complete len:271 (+) Transcript_134172:46-858(+)
MPLVCGPPSPGAGPKSLVSHGQRRSNHNGNACCQLPVLDRLVQEDEVVGGGEERHGRVDGLRLRRRHDALALRLQDRGNRPRDQGREEEEGPGLRRERCQLRRPVRLQAGGGRGRGEDPGEERSSNEPPCGEGLGLEGPRLGSQTDLHGGVADGREQHCKVPVAEAGGRACTPGHSGVGRGREGDAATQPRKPGHVPVLGTAAYEHGEERGDHVDAAQQDGRPDGRGVLDAPRVEQRPGDPQRRDLRRRLRELPEVRSCRRGGRHARLAR